MRIKNFVASIVCALSVTGMTVAAQAGCGCGGMSSRSYYSLSGEPCFSPAGCTSVQGCCECPPSACDNAWDGYCQHKAKWQAFFAKVGTPHSSCYGNCGNGGSPTPAVREMPSGSAPSPTPAANPGSTKPQLPPPPTPEKTSRAKVLYPWSR